MPAHFPSDSHGLARFDGTHLYEHADARQGYHPDWHTLIFNFGRTEVVQYLLNNALFWFDRYHVDGLRVDAVASMLYLDYSRKVGEWVPNAFGGNENLEAIAFLKRTNEAVYAEKPGIMMIAEGIDRLAWRLEADRCRRSRVRLQMEHGLDARHAQLYEPRTRASKTPSSPDDIRYPLRVQREHSFCR